MKKLLVLLYIIIIATGLKAQSITVNGTVSDIDGVTLPGVNVSIKNKMTGTVTGINGDYAINVAYNDTLVFSFIGYMPEVIPVNGQTIIDVSLIPKIESLQEVVVVGYGTVKKSDLTGAVTQVNSKDFENEPIVKLDQILKGRAAGVFVTQTSGAPGSVARIRIRGINSVNRNNDPLYVIDGIPGDISTVNVNDIESIEILKDASATAIYGNRGANGVVLITTKKGEKGTTVTFDYFFGVDQIPQERFMDVLDAPEYMELVNIHKGQEFFTQHQIDSARTYGLGTNWQDEQFRTGLTENYQLSVSTASDETSLYMSGNYINQTGAVINTGYNKYSLRTNLRHSINDFIDIGLNTNLVRDEKINSFSLGGLLFESVVWSPHLDFDAEVDPIGRSVGGKHPVKAIEAMDNNETALRLNGNIDLKINLFKGLTFNSLLGVNYARRNQKYYSEPIVSGERTSIEVNDYEYNLIQNSNILNYTTQIGTHSNLSFTGVQEWIISDNYNYGLSIKEIENAPFGYYDLSVDGVNERPWSNSSKTSMLSYLGRVNYSLFGKYLATASLRADGTSVFADGNKWGTFPSAALAWRISEEPIIKDKEIINDLKLRAGYGVVGNQAVGPFATMPILSFGNGYPYTGSEIYQGYYIGKQSPNAELTWESTQQFNIGVDFALSEDKFTFSADYYSKRTNNLLLQKFLPYYLGSYRRRQGPDGFYWTNIGEVTNKGVEFVLGYSPLRRSDMSWNIKLNVSHYQNLVVDVGGEDIPLSSWGVPTHRVTEGKPLGSFFLYEFLGVWKTEEAEQTLIYGTQPGYPKYRDINNDSIIDSRDVAYVGNANPDFIWGLNQTFSWKGFSFNILLTGSHGGKVYDYNYALMMTQEGLFSNTATHKDAYDYYDPETNSDSDVPNVITGERFNSTRFLQDGDYLKIKNLSLSYTIPKDIIKLFNLSVSISSQNVYTFTNYKGYDPELSSTGQDSQAGFNMSTYPLARTITLGARIIF
jgi:TonB-dependent starch-binding outer membrane protein SusC